MRAIIAGNSVEGRPIHAYSIRGSGTTNVLVLGGFHGDEPKGVSLVFRLLELLEREPNLCPGTRWTLVPVVNPDGHACRTRRNVHGVDLNRNFPTRNWVMSSPRRRMYGGPSPVSEPETRAVMSIVQRVRPAVIVTVHSISGGRECNNYDGPANAIARRMARINGYPVTNSIGYPTPGSFGTWAGVEGGIPTITLELPTRHSLKRCWEANSNVWGKALKAFPNRALP